MKTESNALGGTSIEWSISYTECTDDSPSTCTLEIQAEECKKLFGDFGEACDLGGHENTGVEWTPENWKIKVDIGCVDE